MPIITIDGNIGCGKTSVLNHLHKIHKILIDLEPVENWNEFLNKQYLNKSDVFNFQIKIWLDRCWIQEKSEKTLILIERSPYFIKNTFINTAYNQKLLTETEKNILFELHKKTDHFWSSNIYIYLRSNPENCFNRIQKRKRECEHNITLDYIKTLHDSHEKNYDDAIKNNMNIIVIDVENKSIVDIAAEIYNYYTYYYRHFDN